MKPVTALATTSIAAIVLLLLPAADAGAHRPGYVSHAYNRYYHDRVRIPRDMPRWLRRHHDFLQWYGFNRYRLESRLGWRGRYDRYQLRPSLPRQVQARAQARAPQTAAWPMILVQGRRGSSPG